MRKQKIRKKLRQQAKQQKREARNKNPAAAGSVT
jgi:hypothetical protein